MANILFEYFGISAFNYTTMKYFESLTRQAISSRMNAAEPGHDFVQTMTDSLIEAPAGDPDTITDEFGHRWSRKGIIYIHTIHLSMHDQPFIVESVSNTYMYIPIAFVLHSSDVLFSCRLYSP